MPRRLRRAAYVYYHPQTHYTQAPAAGFTAAFVQQVVAQILHPNILMIMSWEWPKKEERECLEIEGFIEAYQRLAHGRTLVCLSKTEKPDFLVKDVGSGDIYGVEVTTVYLDDRSVPDQHIPTFEGQTQIPYNRIDIAKYKRRVAETIEKKSRLAQSGYQTDHTLILSIYINEYISIYMTKDMWQEFVREYQHVFNNIAPFSEVVFWSLANNAGDGVLAVRPASELSVVFSW